MNRFNRTVMRILDQSSWGLLLIVWICLSLLSNQFFSLTNLMNICVQASSTTIVAVGMTFVLLTAGVDLSVGATMFVAAAVAGKLAVANAPFEVCLLAMLGMGLAAGLINAFLISRLGIIPFVATLGSLYIGRGFGLWLTETRAIALPQTFLALGTKQIWGIPLPIALMLSISVVGQLILTQTRFGRHVLAIGCDRAAAEKAGIPTRNVIAGVYVIAGILASLGALISLSQLGTVSPTFGEQREFAAIAVAVIGGTSLLGGRGGIFPGALIGALLIQSVESGLVMLNADPYLYPVIVASIIFVAVLLDGFRSSLVRRLQRRPIFIP